MAQRRIVAAVAVLLATVSAMLVLSTSAGATTVIAIRASTDRSAQKPVALASTGLNLAFPIAVGLITLVVGIALVAWAFLRAPRSRRH